MFPSRYMDISHCRSKIHKELKIQILEAQSAQGKLISRSSYSDTAQQTQPDIWVTDSFSGELHITQFHLNQQSSTFLVLRQSLINESIISILHCKVSQRHFYPARFVMDADIFPPSTHPSTYRNIADFTWAANHWASRDGDFQSLFRGR